MSSLNRWIELGLAACLLGVIDCAPPAASGNKIITPPTEKPTIPPQPSPSPSEHINPCFFSPKKNPPGPIVDIQVSNPGIDQDIPEGHLWASRSPINSQSGAVIMDLKAGSLANTSRQDRISHAVRFGDLNITVLALRDVSTEVNYGGIIQEMVDKQPGNVVDQQRCKDSPTSFDSAFRFYAVWLNGHFTNITLYER